MIMPLFPLFFASSVLFRSSLVVLCPLVASVCCPSVELRQPPSPTTSPNPSHLHTNHRLLAVRHPLSKPRICTQPTDETASLSALAHLSQLSSSLNNASLLESQLIQRGYDPAALGVGSSTLSSSSVIAGLGSASASAGSGGNSSLASILGASNNSTAQQQQQQSNLQAILSSAGANSSSAFGALGAGGSSGGSTPSPFPGGGGYGRRESPESSSRRRGYY